MRSWGITDVGLIRKENQDAYETTLIGPYTVAVVCDGMGGSAGGAVASGIAVRTYREELEKNLRPGMHMEQLREVSDFSIAAANHAIRQRAEEEPVLQRMGTTLVSAIVRKSEVLVSNVGDSRAYLITPGGIRQISRDHSLVESMVERGDLTHEQARRHPGKNLITRALGPDQQVQADTFTLQWKQGEFLLLCTDGLINTVSDQELLFEIIHNDDREHCLQRLMELARQRGAPDNVTAILMMNI